MVKRREKLEWLDVKKLDTLARNPQYLTPAQMEALKRSIERDGFVAPILVRPRRKPKGRFEVVSGNHRLMAARELGHEQVPCVVVTMTDTAARRLALNLNLIHGDPPAQLLAPFLADFPDAELLDVHLETSVLEDVCRFDEELGERLAALEVPAEIDARSDPAPAGTCVCAKCGRKHIPGKRAESDAE